MNVALAPIFVMQPVKRRRVPPLMVKDACDLLHQTVKMSQMFVDWIDISRGSRESTVDPK